MDTYFFKYIYFLLSSEKILVMLKENLSTFRESFKLSDNGYLETSKRHTKGVHPSFRDDMEAITFVADFVPSLMTYVNN